MNRLRVRHPDFHASAIKQLLDAIAKAPSLWRGLSWEERALRIRDREKYFSGGAWSRRRAATRRVDYMIEIANRTEGDKP